MSGFSPEKGGDVAVLDRDFPAARQLAAELADSPGKILPLECDVTDYEGATIWRVPPGGGAAQVWIKDPALDGGPFGLTGIVLSADRTFFYVAMQSQAGLGAGADEIPWPISVGFVILHPP